LGFRARKIALVTVLRILAPSEVGFKLFLDILGESQGSLLRHLTLPLRKLFGI